jgi:hypothetical protein
MLDSAGMTTYEHLAKDQKKKGRFMLSITLVLLLVLLWPFSLHAQAPFYQGKTIRLVAGTPAGSVYDLYARMVAQFIPKHIPGAPHVIVQNMPDVAPRNSWTMLKRKNWSWIRFPAKSWRLLLNRSSRSRRTSLNE